MMTHVETVEYRGVQYDLKRLGEAKVWTSRRDTMRPDYLAIIPDLRCGYGDTAEQAKRMAERIINNSLDRKNAISTV